MACRRLLGKVAVVTASTDGIGLAIAERLAREGARTVISSRRQENVDRAVKSLTTQGLDVLGLQCHVGRQKDRQRLLQLTLDQLGGVDILVSNAAANPSTDDILTVSEEVWDKVFETNVKAGLLLAREFSPHMEKRGGGSIVFVSSVTAFRPSDPLAAYGISKTAVQGLTRALATALATKNIRVNAIAPGIIKTKFSQPLWDGTIPDTVFLRDIPMNRVGTPEECAGTVAFLASDDASYITGETVVIGGGLHCRL